MPINIPSNRSGSQMLNNPAALTAIHKTKTAIITRTMMFLIAVLAAVASYTLPALAATIMPPGETTFFDANGNPLSGGSVYFYIPSTLTPKDTWQDSGQTVLNTNPVVLDAAGRAIIYGSGSYRQIVKDSLGNTIWDQLTSDTTPSTGTAWGGVSGGTANAQTVTAGNYVAGSGQLLEFMAGLTNTGSTTVSINSGLATTVLKPSPSGAIALTGGEIVAGNVVLMSYNGSNLQLLGGMSSATGGVGALTNLASAATTNLGSVPTHNVNITGTTAITSFGSSANTDYPTYQLTFAGSLTLTYNATSLILPSSANITTSAGDTAVAQYLGSGNWKVMSYARLAGTGVSGVQGSIAYIGANGIPALLAPGTAGQILSTSGTGANPSWVNAGTTYQVFTSSGTWTKPSGVGLNSQTYVQCWGGGGGGAVGYGGGGGGGAYNSHWFLTSSLSSAVTVTIGSGAGAGGVGGTTSFGAYLTAYGGGSANSSSTTGGGGGGGLTSAGASGTNTPTGAIGGGPNTNLGSGGNTGGQGGNGSGGGAGTAGGGGGMWGGGGGGGSGTGASGGGGASVYGGGGGGGTGGSTAGAGGASIYGGAGGAGGVAGSVPGGGGGGAASGGSGECTVFTIG